MAAKVSSIDWLRHLGFTGNPFFQEPVPPDLNAIKLAFIDRDEESKKVKRFVGLSAGRLLVLGRTGEGKSSLLNVAEEFASRNGILCVRIDGATCISVERLLERLLQCLQMLLERIDEKKRAELARSVKELDVEEVSEEERQRVEGSVQAGLGALIATIKAKVTGELETGRRILYRPKNIVRTERILEDILPVLFTQLRVLVIFDNTEKLREDAFPAAVEAIDRLPRNILSIATGNYEGIDQSTMKLCYRVFDDFCQMKPVDETAIAHFVQGRLASFALNGKPRVSFDPDALAGLFARTRGNLRETFRYCYNALESYADADVSKRVVITKRATIEAIANIDAPRLAALDEGDKLLLAAIARSGRCTLEKLEKRLTGIEAVGSPATMRRRLDGLWSSGLLLKEAVKRGRTYVTEYSLPDVLAEAVRISGILNEQFRQV